jgi:hypothetical protein
MQNTIKFPTLVRVWCSSKPNGKFVYFGQFADGTRRKIRESRNAYVAVAQIYHPDCGANGEEFVFSSKPQVALGRNQRNNKVAEVAIGLDI